MTVIEYHGAHKWRNIGDIAVYKAAKQVFENYPVIESEAVTDSKIAIIGGGTLLPHILYKDNFTKRKVNAIFGTGIRHPDFWNRRKDPVDLRYLAGNSGLSLKRLVNRCPFPINGGVQAVESRVNGLNIYGDYIRPDDITQIKNIGFDFIGVRGPISKELLSDQDIKAEMIGDPALALQVPDVDTVSNRVAVSLHVPSNKMYGDLYTTIKSTLEYCQ